MSPVNANVTALPLPPAADWQAQARAARISTAALLAELGLEPTDFAAGVIDDPDFPISAPPHYRSLIRRGDPADPLLLQVLALGQEALPQPGRLTDPLEEVDYRAAPGVLRKYRSRALLIASGACAIHCRYCFRRHTDYGAAMLTRSGEAEALALIAGDAAIEEVILSGGDPLSLSDARLAGLVAAIAAIPHVTTLRLHSRTLMAIPDRVTPALVQLLSNTRLNVVLVTHSNHEREISADVAAALGQLRAAGVTLLNQSVLLRHVNDAATTIAAHCRRLFAAGVLPYYLHLTDPVEGTAHFDVDEARARTIEAELRGLLPGYLVPRIVREVPGEAAKTPLWALPI
ncbi:EF-P beta-lysylation protein EpmB [Sandarakinorhabdus sp.]|uniref:EF-P beta-lysylation protein EpmB n=1 Tax=Sandarakinorhabdus sp. TaxID=1916663 RepID=UPI00286E42F1|nr:EF-P beta-lysylation protein EpmB [Sandarakinorhabdus sp.]